MAPPPNAMRAICFDSYGQGSKALKHVEVPIPRVSKGQVLLKLEAASLNPIDGRIHNGYFWPFLPRRFPYIPVIEVAGEVVEVASGVTDLKVGDKAVAFLGVLKGGGLAEFAAAEASLTVARPTEVSAAEAAGLPIAGLTALKAVTEAAGIKLDGRAGKQMNILITAASGGVGHYAVQLAKLGNAHVTATCGARNLELVKSLGADEVIDYKTPEGDALKSPSGKKYDAVIHCAMGIPWSTLERNLIDNGKVIHITPDLTTLITYLLKKIMFSKKQLVPLHLVPAKENMEYLLKLVRDGKLKTVIDSKHQMSRAEDAWAKCVSGHATGKIIIQP